MFNLQKFKNNPLLNVIFLILIFCQTSRIFSKTKKHAQNITNPVPTREKSFRPIRASNISDLREILKNNNFFVTQKGFSYYFLTDFDGVLLPQSGSLEENIDPELAEIIDELKSSKRVIVGGITNRSKKKASTSLSAFQESFGGFNLLIDRPEESFGENGLLKDGVFYVGHTFDKGTALEIIFNKIKENDKKFDPSKIFLCYIDDSPKNLKKINKACKKIGIDNPVIIHYLASDKSMESVAFGGFMNGKFQNKFRRFVRKHFPMFERSFF